MATTVAEIARELLTIEQQRSESKLDRKALARRQSLFRELMKALNRGRTGIERRRFLRVPAPIEVRLATGDATIAAGAAEFGMGGIQLRGKVWLLENQHLRIESVRIADREYPLKVNCRVAWRVAEGQDEPCAGLEFVEPTEEAHQHLREIFSGLFMSYLAHLAAGEEAQAAAN